MLTLIYPCPRQGDLFTVRAQKRMQAAKAYHSAVPLDRYLKHWLRHAEPLELEQVYAHPGPVVVLGVPDLDCDEWIPGLTQAHVEAVEHGVWPAAVTSQVTFADPWLDLGQPVVIPRVPLAELGYGGPATELGSGLLLGEGRRPRNLLRGQRLVVTRAEEAGFELAEALEQHGAEVVNFPCLAFEPLEPAPLEKALKGTWDWVVFTSANGVRFFCSAARDVRKLKKAKLAAIGPATAAALRAVFLEPDLVPPKFVAESLLEAFPEDARKVLICRAEEARDVLPEGLKARGAKVTVVPVYRTVVPQDGPPLEEADRVLFTSSSTVKHFRQLAGAEVDLPVLAIGPITAATAREHGFTQVDEAEVHTTAGMVEWLIRQQPAAR